MEVRRTAAVAGGVRFAYSVLLTLCLAFTLSLQTTRVAYADSVAWLNTQAQLDGSYTTSTDISTAFQSSAEVLRSLQVLQQASLIDTASAWQYLNADTLNSTENLSRKIILDNLYPGNSNVTAAQLFAAQSNDGGFGEEPFFDSTVQDTAYALEALGVLNDNSNDTARALNYLLAQQKTDGGWGDGSNVSSVFVTALCMQGLLPYKGQYPGVTAALNTGESYLLTQRGSNQLWSQTFESSLAILSILKNNNNPSAVSGSVNALLAAKLPDGSWDSDVYQTALALRAIRVSEDVLFDNSLSQIKGSVINAATGLPLAGVTVSLQGSTAQTQQTASDGAFSFSAVNPGAYTLTLTLANFSSVTATVTTVAGQRLNVGNILMLGQQSVTTGSISGTISSADTGQPIAGVTITVSTVSNPVITDINGNYQITNVPAGAMSINADKQGYSSAVGSGNVVAGGLVIFSTSLSKVTVPITAIKGTIVDAVSGLPLSGVSIDVTGSTTVSAITDALGDYQITGLNSGAHAIQVSLAGYDVVTVNANVAQNTVLVFSPSLYTTNTTPVNANTSGVTGVVIDAGSNLPLTGVQVVVTFGTNSQTVTTGTDGRFQVTGLSVLTGSLQFSLSGYLTSNGTLTVSPLTMLDIGQVRLQQAQVTTLLPDLTVADVDITGVVSDQQTANTQGTLIATITNQGTAASPINADVIAFYDVNKNNRYDAGVDLKLGAGNTSSSLVPNTSEALQLSIQGLLPFRDAPILIMVDSQQAIVESDEINNISTSTSACAVKPDIGTFAPILKWKWDGVGQTLAQYDQVMSTPMVANLEDTNADGQINTNDVPSIIFHSYINPNYQTNGVLRAISGVDGSEIWTVTATAYRTNSSGTIALADIDGDGLVEIIVPKSGGNSLLAFEHDGTFKWESAAVNTGFFAGGAIADLDADGVPEIIYGKTVFNADGSLRWQGSGFEGKNHPTTGPLSLVADINRDGVPEIVAGAAAYSSTGVLLWQNNVAGDGFTAVGNFNQDAFPEIVVVSLGKVSLLDYQGVLIWGPVAIPGGGYGGAPTIADMDGDGEVEIGVAGAGRYVVFNADGSILWQSVTRDVSSSMTGSSVFDFDGDGKAEVVYGDEQTLRVYNGQDGSVLFSIPNTSGTTYEMPVVVDIDNDNHAEIVVVANQLQGSAGITGIRVYEDINDSWVNTRRIWNQHTYHITNINDDGTVPAIEKNSWDIHNTYRLNTQPGVSVTTGTDLTASLLKIINQGASIYELQIRVGNAGSISSPAGVAVSFYEGDPNAGGILLGTVQTGIINGGEYQDVRLDGVSTLSGNLNLYAVVDSANSVAECREDNNTTSIPGPLLIADLLVDSVDVTGVLTDLDTLTISGTVLASITNNGTLSASGSFDLTAYYDADNSGSYTANQDILLGTMSYSSGLNAGTTSTVQIPVTGNILFRDAPVSVWVDSANAVPESLEDNNTQVSSAACSIQPSKGSVVTDPNSTKTWLGASVGTFAGLLHGSNTPANRQKLIDNQTLVDGIFDPTGTIPAKLISAGGSGGCLGTSTGVGFGYYCSGGSNVALYADQIDNKWFQTSGVVGNTVFDLGFQAEKVAVFNSIDHGPLPNEAIESTVYLSNDRVSWTQAVTERIWLEGYTTSEVYDGFVYTVGIQGGGSFRYVSVIHGGPDALVRDGDNEINGLLGLQKDLSQGIADLTVAQLSIIDNGFGQPFGLSVRAGNSGATASPANITVAFYEGDPAIGGTLLGSVSVGALAAGGYKDIQLDGVTGLNGVSDIYAVIDPSNLVIECDETNNQVNKQLGLATLGSITVQPDQLFYEADTPATFVAVITNTGGRVGDFTSELTIVDSSGVLVKGFSPQSINQLASGATVNNVNSWNTGKIVAGTYLLVGILRDTSGNIVSQASSAFTIGNSASGVSAAISSVVSDKPVYKGWDTVNLTGRIQNISANVILPDTFIEITVKDPSVAVIYYNTVSLNEMLPGALKDLPFAMPLADAAIGQYAVSFVVKDNVSRQIISSSSTTFAVARLSVDDLAGTITATPRIVFQGEAVACDDTLLNKSAQDIQGVSIIRQVLRQSDGVEISNSVNLVNILANSTQRNLQTVNTASLSPGVYYCMLSAQLNSTQKQLAASGFEVLQAPINIDTTINVTGKGRLLALLTPLCTQSSDSDSSFDDDSSSSHSSHSSYSSYSSYSSDDDSDICDNTVDIQRNTYLGQLLQSAGWSYTIATSVDEFTTELHSGGYSLYAIFSSIHDDDRHELEDELQEIVNRGEGLVVANLDEDPEHALGLDDESIGTATGLNLSPSALHDGGTISFNASINVAAVELQGATAVASFDQLQLQNMQPINPDSAITMHDYGLGKGLYIGFDILEQAYVAGTGNDFENILLNALEYVNPIIPLTNKNSVIPIEIRINNLGNATPGRVVLTLPANAVWADVSGLTQIDSQTAEWIFTLPLNTTLTKTIWVQLLDEQVVKIQASIQTGVVSTYIDYGTAEYSVIPASAPDLNQVIQELSGYATPAEDFAEALQYLDDAKNALAINDQQNAHKYLIEAAEELDDNITPAIQAIRLKIDLLISDTGLTL